MLPQRRLSHARGYLELGMVAEAAAELERVPAPENTGLDFLRLRVAVLHEQQDWPGLAEVGGDYARRAPAEAAAWVTWAYATRRARSLAAAEKILLEAVAHHASDPTIQFNLGCYACQRGDLAEARRRVDAAIALDPDFRDLAGTDPDLAPLRAGGADPAP